MVKNPPSAPFRAQLTHAQIVSRYIQQDRSNFANELAWFAAPASFPKAVQKAAMAEDRLGKRFPHQRRLETPVIPAMDATLARQPKLAELKRATTFAALYAVVKAVAQGISGAGALYVYDTALRLGASMQLAPTEVFLQAGTLVGAKKLLPQVRGPSVDLHVFPQVFHRLSPAQMGHLLWIDEAQL